MAIVKMQKLSVCANQKNRKAILETLQNLGTVEVFTVTVPGQFEGYDAPAFRLRLRGDAGRKN